MWPHPQLSSHLLSGPMFLYVSTRYHTPGALIPFLIKLCATLLPFTMKTTENAAIPLFCLLSLMVLWFASHRMWVGISIPSFSAGNSSGIIYRHSVPFLMYCMRGTEWIISLFQDSFSSTTTTPVSSALAGMMVMSRYYRAMSAVAFGCVIALIAPLALLLAFMILMWVGAFWLKSALLIADAIYWSILLESGTLSSLLNIRHISTMLDPTAWARPGPGPTGAL